MTSCTSLVDQRNNYSKWHLLQIGKICKLKRVTLKIEAPPNPMVLHHFPTRRIYENRKLWYSGMVDNPKSIRKFIQDQSWAPVWRPQPLVLWGPPPPSLGTEWWAHLRISPGPPPGMGMLGAEWREHWNRLNTDNLWILSLIHSFLSSNHTKKRNFGFGRFYRICRYEYSTVDTSVFSMHITMYTYNLITQIYIWSNYYISRVVGRISYFKVWN